MEPEEQGGKQKGRTRVRSIGDDDESSTLKPGLATGEIGHQWYLYIA